MTDEDLTADRWSRFATAAMSGGPALTAYSTWLNHVTTLGYMLQVAPPPSRVLSIGCGTAMLDVLLAAHGYAVTSIDSDADVLETAARSARRFEVELEIQQADAF